ncbi:MAG: SCO family protein [Bacteroidota bacterium]
MALALVLVTGAGLLWWGTDGLRAFSTEGARRLSVEENPRLLPAGPLVDHLGNRIDFPTLAGQRVLVEFIYTRCPTICTTLGESFQQIATALPAGGDPVLLSISFDPEHDDQTALRQYAERFRADGHIWRIARVEDRRDLEPLLRAFGVVAIPDGFGGFVHNAAIHEVDRGGRLTRLHDYDAGTRVLAEMRTPP